MAEPNAARNMPLFLAARLAGSTGVEIQGLAVGYEIYERTNDVLHLGTVGAVQYFPLLLLSLYSGSFADRHDRKTILTVCRVIYVFAATTLALFALNPGWGILPIYAVLAVVGATRAFAWPASSALLTNLVPGRELPRAVALSSTGFQVATIAGPPLGGLLYAVAGPSGCYSTSAALFAVSGVFIWTLRPVRPVFPRDGSESGLERILSGFRFVASERVLLGALSLDLFAVLLGGAVALLPVYARDILEVGPEGLGWLRAAPAFGAVGVALFVAARPFRRRAGIYMFVCVGLFGVATVVFGLSSSFPLSLGALFVLGAADMVSVVIRQSLVQLWTPDEMRGRVSAVNMVFIGASNELGAMESGYTAKILGDGAVGAVRSVVLGGIGTLVVTGLWAAWFPSLRRIDAMEARVSRGPAEPGERDSLLPGP